MCVYRERDRDRETEREREKVYIFMYVLRGFFQTRKLYVKAEYLNICVVKSFLLLLRIKLLGNPLLFIITFSLIFLCLLSRETDIFLKPSHEHFLLYFFLTHL